MKQKKRPTTKQKKEMFHTIEKYIERCKEKREKLESHREKKANELNTEFTGRW